MEIKLDRLPLCQLAKRHEWSFAVFSPENAPIEQHMASMAEKYIGKPFTEGPTQRMSRAEFTTGLKWVEEHFKWILPSDES
jgi:twinkle protein